MAPQKGFKHSSETRARMSAAHKGRPKAPEHIAKIVAARQLPLAECQEMTRLYQDGLTWEAIAKQTGHSKFSIVRALQRVGVSARRGPRRLPPAQVNLAIDRYLAGASQLEAATLIGASHRSIGNELRRRGIPVRETSGEPRRLHPLNEHYFDEIDTEAKAYWLGWIAADGNVYHDRLSLVVKQSDQIHLATFAEAVGSTAAVTFRAAYRQATLRVNSKRLMAALLLLGITPRKSLTVLPWAGPPDLMRHYWRGVFDGDGCFYHRPSRGSNIGWDLTLVGNRHIVSAFAEWCRSLTTTRSQPHMRVVKSDHMGFSVSGWAAKDVARALYEGASIALPRKQALAKQLLAWTPTRRASWMVSH